MKIIEKKINEASSYGKKIFGELDKFVDKFDVYFNAKTSKQYVLALTILFGEYVKYAHKNMSDDKEYNLTPKDILAVFNQKLM